MKLLKSLEILQQWDRNGKFVFTSQDLYKIFYSDNRKTCIESINRLVKSKILIHACRSVYVNPNAKSFDSYVIEHIAKALRYGEYNYISLESILSEYGIISQIPIDRLTVMTTGRRGLYKTTYGIIEFTHTRRQIQEIISGIIEIENRPLRIATAQVALRDLKRVGRNTDMIKL